MKHSFLYKILFFACVFSVTLLACKKDDYLHDGGTHNPVTPLSNYDYLAAQQYHDFDTVLMIIDHFNLKDSVNSAKTFFAPTDYSVHRLMSALGVTSMDSLYTLMTSKIITQYLFPDAITLDAATTATHIYNNWADTIAGVKKTANLYGTATSTLTYYVLQYVKINGYPDGSSGTPAEDPTDAVLNCQTSGIKTSSGSTTLHVLSNLSSLSLK